MSLLFVDSFDHYATADLGQKYESFIGATIVSAESRNGPQSCLLGSGSHRIDKKFTSHATWVVGLAVKLDAEIGGSSNHDLISLIDDLEATSSEAQVTLQYTGGKKFRVVRGNETVGTELAISDGTFDLHDAWHYIEFKATINNSTGSFDAQFDGVQIAGIETSSVDTQNGSNAFANRVSILSLAIGGAGDHWIDDLYIINGAAPGAQDFLGDMKIDALFPKADGNYEEFDTSSGTDSFDLVNNNPPDGDSNYVESNTLNEKDSFDMDDAGNFTIHGVQHVVIARKVGSNVRKMKHLARVSGADKLGDAIRMGESYSMKTKMWETNPATGSSWTASQVNGSEFGMEVV